MIVLRILLFITFCTTAFASVVDDTRVAVYCSQPDMACNENDWLEKAQWACELELKALNCSKLKLSHSEDKLRKCDIKSRCEELRELQKGEQLACLRGYKNALVDLGISLKDMTLSLAALVEDSWDKIKQNAAQRKAFLRQCETSVICKRDLVREDPRYNKLSDAKLDKYSAIFLDVEVRELQSYKSSLKRARKPPYVPISERLRDDVTLTSAQSGKLSLLLKLAKESLSNQYDRYACYSELARTELECYALGNVIDPLMVAGYFAKGARATSTVLRAKTAAGETAESVGLVNSLAWESSSNPAFFRGATVSNEGATEIGSAAKARAKARARLRAKARARIAARDPVLSGVTKSDLLGRYLSYSPTSVAENEKWMALAAKGVNRKVTFLDVENSQMKYLNDSLSNKNLVTGLTNFHKEILFKRIELLKEKYPDLKVDVYSDFKSSRFAFSGRVPRSIKKELEQILKDTNAEFEKHLKDADLAEGLEDMDQWFRAGIGRSADQANLSARFSRQFENNELQNFQSFTVQASLKRRFKEMNSLKDSLRSEVAGTSMLDGNTFHQDVYDIVRKGKGDLDAVSRALKQRFGLSEIPMSTVKKMEDYVKRTDEFSPGIHVAKREVAHLNEAVNGGLSADIIGLGAANLKGTAEAISRSKNLDEVLALTRKAEGEVTRQFAAQKAEFQDVLKQAVGKGKLESFCSGDDCVAVAVKPLNQIEKERILDGLSEGKYAGSYRLAFIPEGVVSATERNALANHGESIEKILRQTLSKEMDPRKLKGLTFAVDMQTQNLNQGGLKLLTGQARDLNVTPSEYALIKKRFSEAVAKFNEDITKDGVTGSYHSL